MYGFTVSVPLVAGHSCSASSASRPFLFIRHDPLVNTYLDSNGFGWGSFDELPSYINNSPYNLEDLFCEVGFTDSQRHHYSRSVSCSRNLGGGCHPIAWVKSLIEKFIRPSCHLSYTADIKLDAFDKGLIPFLCSLDNRPDGVVRGSFQCNGIIQWMLPLFILEIHSSPYKNTVSQTATDVIDQLRLLRCFDANIQKCVGFTFPKYPTDNCSNQTCVTKVTVSFQKFKFVITLTPLQKAHVKAEIVQALTLALQFQADLYPLFSFMRFSPTEIVEATREMNVHGGLIQQYPTKHSILFKNDSTFWKYVPHTIERENLHLLQLAFKQSKPRHITLPCDIVLISNTTYFVFPAQLSPLTKEEVSKCLYDFMTMTATALEELHSFGFAHLDVRIPNVCFARNGDNYIVKLIDLDRCITDEVGKDLSGYEGEMYKPQQNLIWKPSQYDWKQLGLLAAEIMLNITDHSVIVKDGRVDEDNCLKVLIKRGKYLGSKYNIIATLYMCSCCNVFAYICAVCMLLP